ncbi:MAG: DEAD/DEAH box helicase family protein, partial [Bacteroidales bacterium]|nr:DEAD/DEAH box helicase family protein [Bacteroidales bacterium]
DEKIIDFLGFIQESEQYKQIFIRPEVLKKIETAFNKEMLSEIKNDTEIDFSVMKAKLFQYQKEGIEFAAFREGAIIADEMGLGKTLEAIGTALIKKEIYGFKKTLIICPASIKEQWKREIEHFSDEKATIVEGLPYNREEIYKTSADYFLIVNYETVLRDSLAINKYSPDFIILDEAQRIKNYSTLTSNSIKSLNKKHSLVITGTPIENRLIDLYSIVNFIDPKFLSPLWEFSYQHCYFDQNQKNKITGYYNLLNLKNRLNSILIRREKKDVLKQLPNVSQIDIPVEMHIKQREYHASYASGIAKILSKKFITPFDMQRLMLLLSKMRMVCDSTYLVDLETNFSPKLLELTHILIEKLDIKNNNRKIIIFSEWKRMNKIIGKMLRDNDIGFVELHGSIPVKNRGKLIREFEQNENCKVFVSTEAGGTGLNLQVADTVINFELPWNPAKKNQRIGRIDRIGQKSENLTVINFITKDSIEMKIASGLMLKQNLFESVLSPKNKTETVDFSEKGRAQFLNQLQEVMSDFEEPVTVESDIEEKEIEKAPENIVDLASEIEEESPVEKDTIKSEKEKDLETKPSESTQQTVIELEQVMNQGLGFLSGLFKMATGKDLATGEQSITVDKESGEVTMKFKLPI